MKKITVDLVIFQLQPFQLGVSRIWNELLPRLVKLMPDVAFDFLVRGTNPGALFGWMRLVDLGNKNVRVFQTQEYQFGSEWTSARGSDLFISTYYTYSDHCPNLLYVYDMIPETLGWSGNEWEAKKLCMNKAQHLMAMSKACLDNLSMYDRDLSRKVLGLIPGGIDHTKLYPATPEEIASFKTEAGIEGDYIVCSGRRGLYKNGDSVFNMLSLIDEDKRPTVLLAGGEGVPTLSEKLQVETVFAQHLEDEYLRLAYSGAQCLWYPSDHEGFGLPVLEAMACGCPVVFGSAPAFQEFAVGVKLESPWNAQEAFQAYTHTLEPSTRQGLIEQGLQAAKHWSWDTSAARLQNMIEELWK